MDREELVVRSGAALRSFSPTPADAKRYALRLSSGTSGSRPLFSFTKLRPELLDDWFAGAKRTLVCYGPRAVRLFNFLVISQSGGQSLILDGDDIAASRAELLRQFAPTRIIGVPVFVLRVAALMPSETRHSITSLRLAGELITGSIESALRNFFPNAVLTSMYVATELGSISAPSCGYLPRNHYHVRGDTVVEVSGADEHGIGELLISKPLNAVPVARYRVGDVGRLYDRACPCGATQALEILGRSGRDYIKLAGGLLRVEAFDRVMARYKNLIQDYRVDATTFVEGGSVLGKVAVRIYCAGMVPTDALQEEVKKSISGIFVTPTRTLGELIAERLFAPLEVTFVSEPFPQGHKAGRLRYHA